MLDVGLSLFSILKSSLVIVSAPMFDPAYGLLGFALKLSLRAALLPSPALRTLSVGLASLGILGAARAISVRPMSFGDVWFYVLGMAFVAVTVICSRVIYGLRRDVRHARRLGQYELIRKIGEGGMGVVYEATHVLLKRPTALKLLPVDKVGAQAVARFEREVHHTSRLEHPNSIYIYDYGHTPDGQFYYAMEYIDGFTLEALVRRDGPVSDARARAIVLQVAHALAEAHAKGLVHRDIKPANIMLCERGGVPDMVKVLDFGLVKSMEGTEVEAQLTHADAIVGTAHYMAPEALNGDEVGPQADVYAVGAVAFFLLTGQTLFSGKSIIEVCAKHLNAPPTPPSALAEEPIDPSFEALIMQMVSKSTAERPRDGVALVHALKALELSGWALEDAEQWWRTHRPEQVVVTGTEPTQLAIELHER
ncbi:MAG: serine/threonine-protein kinase [Bradymonadia bacterium]